MSNLPAPVDTDRLERYFVVRVDETVDFHSRWATRHVLAPAVPELISEVKFLRKELAARDEQISRLTDELAHTVEAAKFDRETESAARRDCEQRELEAMQRLGRALLAKRED